MAGRAGEAFVDVKPDVSGFGTAVGRGVASETESATKRIGSQFQSVGAGMTAGLTAPLVLLGAQSVKAASQLEDVSAAAEVTFGKASGAVERFADSSLESFGITETAALDSATAFAALGKSAGLQGKELAGFSTQMVGLAGDLSSFRGTSVEEALTAIGSGLRGEAEPLRKYGVLLDDASLRQEALRQGLVKTTKEALTPQQKVLAAQALILKQTSDAQGDFKRTGDSTANTLKVLQGSFQELTADLGTALLPVIKSIAGAIVPWLEKFSSLSPTVKTIIVVVGGLVAAIGPLLLVIGTIITIAPAIGTALSVAFGPVGLIIAAVVLLGVIIVKNWDTIKRVTLSVWNAVKSATLTAWNVIKTVVVTAVKVLVAIMLGPLIAVVAVIVKNWKTIKSAAIAVWNFVRDLVVGVAKAIWGAIKLYFGFYAAIIRGAWDGIKAATSAVWDFIRGIPGKLLGLFSDAGTWLIDAGKAIIDGLWNGLKDKWDDVTGWVGDIGGWIADHKGPIDKDRKLLVPHGKAIMEGFGEGLKAGFEPIKDFVPNVANVPNVSRGPTAFRGASRALALTGALTLTADSDAYVRGVLQDEGRANARHARTLSRMRSRDGR